MANIEFLRIARKSGKLLPGNTLVEKNIRKGKLLIFASDFSEKERNRFIRMAERLGIPYIILQQTKEELGNLLGRRPVGVLLIIDENIAEGFLGADGIDF